MKLLKTASGKQTIKLYKSEWKAIGKKAGWTKEARFGPYMDGENSTPWTKWKSSGYDANNQPKKEEAYHFVEWVENLINFGSDKFMPKDEMHDHLWRRLEKIKDSTENVIKKALLYQGALHEIERSVRSINTSGSKK